MRANEEKKEVGAEIDPREFGEYQTWNDFLKDWKALVKRGNPSMILMRGLVHGGASISLTDPQDRLRRIGFYLELANRSTKDWKYIRPAADFVELAYDRLLAYLLRPDIYLYIAVPNTTNPYDLETFVKILNLIVRFFSQYLNGPRDRSHHKQHADIIEELLTSIYLFRLPPNANPELVESLTKTQKDIPVILAIHELYEPIVEHKMYHAMYYLNLVLGQDKEQMIMDRLLSLSALDESPTFSSLIANLILALHLRPDSAFKTYLILWAMKNAPKPETAPIQPEDLGTSHGSTMGLGADALGEKVHGPKSPTLGGGTSSTHI